MRALARISPRMSRRMLGTAVMAGTLALAPLSAPVASGTTATLAGAAAEEFADDATALSGARTVRGADSHAAEPNELTAAKAQAMDDDLRKKLASARSEGRLSASAEAGVAAAVTIPVYFHVIHSGTTGKLSLDPRDPRQ